MCQRKWCKNENDQKVTQKAVKWGILSWEVSEEFYLFYENEIHS